LVVSLIVEVDVAGLLSPAIEERVKATDTHKIMLGISIAMLVIVLKGFTAVRANNNAIFRAA
jgi:hypothetical protein